MKKLISICIIFVMVMLSFNVLAMDDDYSPRVPKLLFTDIKEIPEVSAGDKLELKLTLKNDSTNTASSIKISPELGELPITWDRATDYSTIKSLSRNKETTIYYNFSVNTTAKIGTYGIKFNFEFQNIRDEAFNSSQTIYFKVVDELAKPSLTISNVKTTPDNPVAGERIVLSYDLINIGELDAKNLYISYSNLSKDTFMPVFSSDTQYVECIKGGEKETVFFDLLLSKNITKGTNELEVTVNFEDQLGTELSSVKTLYITDVISSNEAPTNEGGTPKVIIDSYYTNPSKIIAGDTINFGFTFTNTNSSKSIKNVKITVASEDGAFNIAKGSNTFYIESLAPKASMQKNIELNVKQDLTSNSYPINISFDYEDANDESYKSVETISLPVTEYSKLVINSVYANETSVGSTTSLSFDYINMGKAKISNLTATVEGAFTPKQSVNYIGNLDTGTSDYYDIEIVANEAGEATGTLILAFEDSSGRKIEERKDFTCFVMEAFDPGLEPGGDMPIDPMPFEEPSEPLNIWKLVGYGVASLIVSFLVTKLIATKIFRKKLEDEI